MPGAEPYHHDGGPTGVLLVHGFTGSPWSMRPWGEFLAGEGLTVSVPRLPGHGTRWQEMNVTTWPDWYAEAERAFAALRDRCGQVFVMGLSMGGTLALRLAEQRGDEVAGIVLVNPAVQRARTDRLMVSAARWVLPTVKGVSNDIKKPGQDERAYARTPLKAAHSFFQLLDLTRADLGRVTSPLLLFHSLDDHVVDPVNATTVLDGVSSGDKEDHPLRDSYHVATIDNDAETIFKRSLEFVRRLSPAG